MAARSGVTAIAEATARTGERECGRPSELDGVRPGRLAPELVAKAFFISLIAFVAMNSVAWLLLLTEGRNLLTTLFETTSAFGTVGLSMGENGAAVSLSGFFTPAGKCLMMLMMFIARLGPLTLAIAVARRGAAQAKIRYPEGKILVG